MRVLSAALLALALPVGATDLPLPAHDDAFVEGVALGLYFEEDGRTYVSFFWEIAQAGADTVSLVLSWHQHSVRSTEVRPEPATPSDEELRRAIQDARSVGLDVMLLPILRLETREVGEWRGVLRPDDSEAWFASYSSFVLHYAEIAAEEGVALYSVGSELGSMETHEAEWRTLIQQVRGVFHGQLTYSANWDHYRRTPFWDVLDLAGTTGYHELSDQGERNPTMDELQQAWAPIVDELQEFAESVERPVLITEIGYVSQTGAAYHPWDYTATGPVDLAAQRDLYEAFYRAVNGAEWLGGVAFWSWFGDGGSSDDGYTPRGKPAEQVVRQWFGADPNGAP